LQRELSPTRRVKGTSRAAAGARASPSAAAAPTRLPFSVSYRRRHSSLRAGPPNRRIRSSTRRGGEKKVRVFVGPGATPLE